jgi:hypothetical protein
MPTCRPRVHQSPQESTRVWTGSMPMPSAFSARSPRIHRHRGALEKTLYPESRQGRAQAAGGRFETGRDVAHHHARHPAPGHVEHLLWAMERAHPWANAGESTVPLPIMTSPARAKLGAVAARGRVFPGIGARAMENLPSPEKQISGRARHQERPAALSRTQNHVALKIFGPRASCALMIMRRAGSARSHEHERAWRSAARKTKT